jgi:hypothetical protein
MRKETVNIPLEILSRCVHAKAEDNSKISSGIIDLQADTGLHECKARIILKSIFKEKGRGVRTGFI